MAQSALGAAIQVWLQGFYSSVPRRTMEAGRMGRFVQENRREIHRAGRRALRRLPDVRLFADGMVCGKDGARRDVVGELAREVRNQRLKFGVSTHRNWHWSWYTYDEHFDTVNPR